MVAIAYLLKSSSVHRKSFGLQLFKDFHMVNPNCTSVVHCNVTATGPAACASLGTEGLLQSYILRVDKKYRENLYEKFWF